MFINILKIVKFLFSTSLYEDPGASIIQAVFCNKFVISSNCKNGPREILINGDGGILYDLKNDKIEDSFQKFLSLDPKEKKECILRAKKNINKYSIFRHFVSINKLINKI